MKIFVMVQLLQYTGVYSRPQVTSEIFSTEDLLAIDSEREVSVFSAPSPFNPGSNSGGNIPVKGHDSSRPPST